MEDITVLIMMVVLLTITQFTANILHRKTRKEVVACRKDIIALQKQVKVIEETDYVVNQVSQA